MPQRQAFFAATRLAHPLVREASARLEERLADIRRDFQKRAEWGQPTAPAPFDLITSTLALQTTQDMATELRAIRAALADGGLFLGVVMGDDTFHELRTSLSEAEVVLRGGASPRVHPMPQLEQLSRELTAAGFALPVADRERVTLAYPDLFALMRDLRTCGCANSLAGRDRRFAPHNLFTKAQAIYAARFPAQGGGITVTIDLLFAHGWRE